MLVLKMMRGDESLNDLNLSKGFVLAQIKDTQIARFYRDETGQPLIEVTEEGSRPATWAPSGNTYVLQDGKQIACFTATATRRSA